MQPNAPSQERSRAMMEPEFGANRERYRRYGLALRPRLIAIDGPAGSGKSTVGLAVAQVLDFLFFDTGAMYRAVTWAALQRGVAIADEDHVGEIAEGMEIDILPAQGSDTDGRTNLVLADGVDISLAIRRSEVDQQVSAVSAYRRVRVALSRQQRRVGERYGSGRAEKPGIVMVGRDIGTVIAPDAALKVYLDATAEVRARRRQRQLQALGKRVDFDQVLADILRRDELDSGRALSPLRVAEDAVVVDTSQLDVPGVMAAILALVEQSAGVMTGADDGQ
jgi:cytidylate kinase